MSTPPADPADFAACADHEQAYPIGGSCPECDADEARELAKRWAAWHTWAVQRRAAGDFDAEYEGPWDPHGEAGSDRERLSTWVRERMAVEVETMLGVWAECGGHGITRDEAHEAISHAVKMDLELTPEQALALCEAAGWPS